ncbi:MAG: hypothetical protein KY392_01230 [Chloroflexi bacterium]|nr:hypothetical protein [Chloroflexota bacterium]
MTVPTSRLPALPDDPERSLAEAEAEAIVIWRGERISLDALPDRIARSDDREDRDRMLGAYLEALEALSSRGEHRLANRPDPDVAASQLGIDPRALVADLEGFVLHTETPYYAALRRYLALIDIEQGDATIADIWHVARGGAWSHWFSDRDLGRVIEATGRIPVGVGGLEGWLAAERMLRGDGSTPGAAAVGAAYATLAGSPEWIEGELGMVRDEVVPYIDFAAFTRLWQLRQMIGELQFQIRISDISEPALARAYYGGILGHMTGVRVPEAMYLVALEDEPFAPARDLGAEILGADLVAILETRHGSTWWRDPAARDLTDAVAAATSFDDALAQLGYDALDWRPVLRQIRTRLIGEMSGYGGPNITTRAGTRKV